MSSAGIYTRLSEDPDGTSTATTRQCQDCVQLAELRGDTVVEHYEDNNESAYQKKVRRPAFERLIADVRSGRIDTVIVWRSDRFARQPRDLERFIDAAEASGAQLVSVTEPEFSGRTGLLILRMLVAFASHESGVKSERVARKIKEQAELGAPRMGGYRPFGYTAAYEPHPVEAPLYREAVDRVLSGERPNAICRDWIERGVPTVKGGNWTISNFFRMLRAGAQGGIRVYHGRHIDGTWEALVPRERWERMQAVLSGQGHAGGYTRTVTRHFLTGLVACELCGTPMQGCRIIDRRSKKVSFTYRCSPQYKGGCGRMSMDGPTLEGIVERRFLHVAGTDRFAALVADQSQQGEAVVLGAMARLREDESSLEQLTKDHYVERSIPRPAFLAAKDALEARIAATRTEVARHASPALSASCGDPEALQREWQARGPAWRRSVLEALVRRIVVKSAAAGPRTPTWWTDRVTIEWLI